MLAQCPFHNYQLFTIVALTHQESAKLSVRQQEDKRLHTSVGQSPPPRVDRSHGMTCSDYFVIIIPPAPDNSWRDSLEILLD
jgi:hypothetical protein